MYYFGSLRFAFLGLPLVTLENSVLGISYAIVVATNRQGSWDDRNVMARGAVSLAAVLGRSTDAMESGRKTPAIGGEAKTTFMSSSTVINQGSQEQQCSSCWWSYRFQFFQGLGGGSPSS